MLPFYNHSVMIRYLAVFISLIYAFQVNGQTLKVMSYNIHIGQDSDNVDQLESLAKFIKSSKADLIGLQEVDSVCNRSGNVDQIKFLAEKTGMYYAYARHFAFDGGSYGIGILSRYPLTNVKDHRLILTSSGTEDAATRALLTADVFSGRKKLTFATVHMDYRDSNSRLAQSEEMAAIFGEMKLPVILTGDFNARPGTKELMKLQTVFTDTTNDSAITFPATNPLNKIDYIMVSKDNLDKVVKQEVYPVLYSDHLPVMSVLKIKSK